MRRALLAAVLALCLSGCDVTIPTFETTTIAPTPPPPTSTASVITGDLADFLLTQGRRARIERVIDGDTIAVIPGDERVRLLTADASEMHAHTKTAPDCGAVEAKDALTAKLPVGTEVILNGLKGEPDKDRYGRTLSNVYLPAPDGTLLNVSLWLVEQGWAVVYTAYPTADSADAETLQEAARAAGRGLWGSCPVPS